MPIYAYRCEACSFAKDVLQKISDPVLTECLSCGQPTFKKQLTAAGFQLKGTGWYATDFRGGATPATPVAGSDGNAETGQAEKPTSPAAAPAAATPASESKAGSGGDTSKAA